MTNYNNTQVSSHTLLSSAILMAPPSWALLLWKRVEPEVAIWVWRSVMAPSLLALKMLFPLKEIGKRKLSSAPWMLAMLSAKVLQIHWFNSAIQYRFFLYQS